MNLATHQIKWGQYRMMMLARLLHAKCGVGRGKGETLAKSQKSRAKIRRVFFEMP